MKTTGNAVAQLTINQMRHRQDRLPSPASSDNTEEMGFQQRGQFAQGGTSQGRAGAPPHRVPQRDRGRQGENGGLKNFVPKMHFSTFDGNNPCIWKDKCEDYFRIFNLPETMWPNIAAMHMDEKPSKWLKVYKQKHVLDDWASFISAVEQKFGNNDYRESLT